MQNSIEKLRDLPERAKQVRAITWPNRKKPSNEEVYREKRGKLQMGGHHSKKRTLKCSTWDARGRNNQSRVVRKGRR